jgi:hypothetical protein
MIQIEFSEEDKNKIDYERHNHPHPRVQRKMEALWLKSQDIAHNEICRLTGISKDTLIRYLKGNYSAYLKSRFHIPRESGFFHWGSREGIKGFP